MIVVSGSANPQLGAAVAAALGATHVPATVERFPDGESHVMLGADVAGRDVCLVQPTGPPSDQHLFELLLLCDACRHGGCRGLTAVVAYLGYARQDRRTRRGEALGLRVVAEVLATARLDHLIVVDPHAPGVETMIGVPVTSVSAVPVLVSAIRPWLPADPVVVAPDLGAVRFAERYAEAFDAPLAYVRKTRISGGRVRHADVVGVVRGHTPIVIDDMISTGATIAGAVQALVQAEAHGEGIVVAAAHGLFTEDAAKTLAGLRLRRLIVTDTLALPVQAPLDVEVVTVAGTLAAAVAGRRGRA